MRKDASLRERKKARTRQAIVQAAMKLFAARGFDGTTVDDIAAAAEVSRRTFFRYFATKEIVMFPHQTLYLQRFRKLLAERRDGESPFEALRRVCLQMAGAYMRSRDEHLRQQRIIQHSRALIARGNEMDTEWEMVIADALIRRMGTGREAQRRAHLMAGALMGAIRATLQEWYAGDCRQDLAELSQEMFALLATGFAGREFADQAPPTTTVKRPSVKRVPAST
jgi:AcrR family transcriptional regulator